MFVKKSFSCLDFSQFKLIKKGVKGLKFAFYSSQKQCLISKVPKKTTHCAFNNALADCFALSRATILRKDLSPLLST